MSNESVWESLKSDPVFSQFEMFVKTPRSSGAEEEIQQRIVNWASEHDWRVTRDAVNNICVHVPGRHGGESADPVVIQNHTDIVVANAPGTSADAAKAEIPLQRVHCREGGVTVADDGAWLMAPETTLGADNGIGCAMAMAIANDSEAVHPPLQLVFTVDEEVGLTGALQLDAEALELTGQTLINLDTEDDDELTIGCAGGMDSEIVWHRQRERLPDDFVAVKVAVGPTQGGHSGVEIHTGRINAIRMLARLLATAASKLSLHLCEISGGDKRNAIPRTSSAVVALSPQDVSALTQSLKQTAADMAPHFHGRDVNVSTAVAEPFAVDCPPDAWVPLSTKSLLQMLLNVPVGVLGVVPDLPSLVETSNNLAIVTTHKDTVTVLCNTRSSLSAAMDDVAVSIDAAARQAKARFTAGSRYPGWAPNLQSTLVKQAAETYRELFSSEPKVHAIHAGLECGVLAERIAGDVESLSFGPNIRGNHAPGERVEITSVQKSYRLLQALLRRLAKS